MASSAAPPDEKWGVHLGNVGDGMWHENFLSRIDGDREGGMWPAVVVVMSEQVYQLDRPEPLCDITGVTIPDNR